MEKAFSISYDRYDKLYELAQSHNKAVLLDKILCWWQTSTITLDDNRIWFARNLSQMSEESHISSRTLERYLSEFVALGLLKKICRLEAKKILYITVTDKLLTLMDIT